MNLNVYIQNFGLCPQDENGIEDIKMAKNANSECENDTIDIEHIGLEENRKETVDNSFPHEQKPMNDAETTSDEDVDNSCDKPVTIAHDDENTDELHSQSIGKVDSVDAIVEQYKNNNDGCSVAPDNDLIVAQKNCNEEENGGKHQFYCQEIPTQAQLAESTPLNSKLKYSGQTDRSKEG